MLRLPTAVSKQLYIMLLSTLIALVTTITVMSTNATIVLEWQMENINSSSPALLLMLDTISLILITAVAMISSSIMFFAKSYMKDFTLNRFYKLVNLFVASMIMFIMSPNMMSMMLGWDGLGLTSFLLVIYYQSPSALGGGLTTILTNRVGDTMLLMVITMMASQGTWNLTSSLNDSMPMILLLLLSAMTKSAQMPFHLWLPEAMAAPTPVSALVHSSTLVTAGIFLLIRSHFLLLPHPNIMFYITATGSFTAFTAANYASTMLDPKKVIALSTMSQLGIMMATVGLGLPQLAYFHLITHAMFKALMFMCAGMIISKKSHSQNLRSVGSADESLLLAMLFKIASLSLNAVPFMAGFYSKDLILEELAIKMKMCPTFMMILFASMLTATYTARLVRGSMTTKPHHHSLPPLSNSHELDQTMITPSLILGVSSISMGAMTAWSMFYTQNMLFVSTSFNIIALFIPYVGFMFAWTTCSCYIKTKNWVQTPANKLGFLMDPKKLGMVKKWELPLGCVLNMDTKMDATKPNHLNPLSMLGVSSMSMETVSESRSDANMGGGVWNVMLNLNKKTLHLSLSLIKYVETSLLELMVPKMLNNLLSYLSKNILIMNKSNLFSTTLSMLLVTPLIIMMIL